MDIPGGSQQGSSSGSTGKETAVRTAEQLGALSNHPVAPCRPKSYVRLQFLNSFHTKSDTRTRQDPASSKKTKHRL